jgi:kinesin family member 12
MMLVFWLCRISLNCFKGLRNRTTGSHRLNEHSSRSHSIMTVYVDSFGIDEEDGGPVVKHGKISFVDLAGNFYICP